MNLRLEIGFRTFFVVINSHQKHPTLFLPSFPAIYSNKNTTGKVSHRATIPLHIADMLSRHDVAAIFLVVSPFCQLSFVVILTSIRAMKL